MSKSSKRRLARAAILNAQPTGTAKSLLAAAAQTAAAQRGTSPRGTGTPAGVPLSLLGLPPQCPNPNSKTPLLDSARATSILPLESDLLVPQDPLDPYVLSDALSPALNSEISNLNSSSDSDSAPSPLPSSLSETPLLNAARTSLLQSLEPDPALAAITPDQIFIDLPPLPPPPPSAFTNSTKPATTHQSPIPPTTPVQDEFADYQAKLRIAMREWSPADPRIKVMLENYATIMQTVTLERLTSTLTTLSEDAWVETNNQIVRLHSVMERTNSRHSREQREIAAQARRELREKQRKERQAQKETEAIARNQRTKDREDQRRQREKTKAELAAQKHELAMRKLDLKERNQIAREQAAQERLKHRNAAKLAESTKTAKPLPPPSEWTCG